MMKAHNNPAMSWALVLTAIVVFGAWFFFPVSQAATEHSGTPSVVQVPISLPVLSGASGGTATIPITVGDVTGAGLVSYDLDLVFDQSVLQLQAPPVDAVGTLSAGLTITPNVTTGRLRISAFGVNALSGSGTLLNLKFNIVGAAGTSTALTWQSFIFNEETQTNLTNGSFTVNPVCVPPMITTQPIGQTVCAGQPATFTVTATGTGLNYQWRKNTVNIAGATAAGFSIPASVVGDAGSYDVVITGTCGTITSNAATLTVNPAANVTGISPTSGAVGGAVTINGSGFTGVTGVKFSNNVVAQFTINSDAMITATVPVGAVSGPITISKAGCADVQTPVFTLAANCIAVSIPNNLTGAPGSSVTIPISVSDLTGRGVVSYDFSLMFDPAVLQLQSPPFDQTGTLSSAMVVTPNTATPGLLTIAAFGTVPLSGAGTLLNLKFNVIGASSACSDLVWVNFKFNEKDPCAATVNGRICVQCPTITVNPAPPLADVTRGAAITPITFTGSGGTAPYTFTISAGALPPGLSLAAGGSLSGTPTQTGSFNFTVRATATGGCFGERAYTLTVVCPTITLSPSTLPNPALGVAYNQTISASGGSAPYSFAVTTGALPAGLSLSSAGVLSGTTTQTGSFSFTVTATDAGSCTGVQSYTLSIGCPTITVNPAPPLSNVARGAPITPITFTGSGGTGPYTFTVSTGALPPGLSLSAGGTLSGTPTQAGPFNFTVRATDQNSCTGERAYTLTVVCPTITLSPTTLPNPALGVAYNQTITASGGTAPYTFAVSAGNLPAGLALDSGGALTGTPTGSGVFSFTVRATDAGGCQGERQYTLSICPLITVNPAPPLANVIRGVPITPLTFTGSGGAGPFTFTISAGALPPGLSLAAGGSLTGTPTQTGSFNFTVRASDGSACFGERAYSLTVVCPTITLSPTTLPNPSPGVAYNQTITANGGTAPYTFAVIAGNLPAGLTLDSGGGLTGAPTAFGAFAFTVRATDAGGCQGERQYTLSICPIITVNPAPPLANLIRGVPITPLTFTGSGGAGPYTFTVSAGALPPGLSLASGGGLTGTPTQSGSFNFTVRASDANSCFGDRAYTLTVICPTITISPLTLPNPALGVPYNQTISASGGTAPYSFSVSAGALPPGLTLSSGGELSGTPTQAGTFNFTVMASDAGLCPGSQSYAVTVAGGGSGLQYYPLPRPIRLLDTRLAGMACFTPGAPLQTGSTRTQLARTICDNITIPANAQAVVGNATVVNFQSAGGFITLYPTGAQQPTVSNLNYTANQIIPNAFTVGLGANGEFDIFASAATDFIVDITGYYAPPGAGGLYYHPLPAPIRLLDTRAQATGCFTPGAPLQTGSTRTQLARTTCNGITIPANAQAVVGNGTVVNFQSAGGFITLWPTGAQQPTVSNLNYSANQIIPNAFTVGLGANGEFNIFASAGTDFIADITGYFSPDAPADVNGAAGLLYNPLPRPIRLLDTRPQATGCDTPQTPLVGGQTRTELAQVTCDNITIPASARAVVGNATVVNFISGGGFITLYPTGAQQPTVSNLNYLSNQIIPNAFTVGLSVGGQFNIFASASTHFIVDLTGYFAP